MPTCTYCGDFFTSAKSWAKYCRACFRLRMEQRFCGHCGGPFWTETDSDKGHCYPCAKRAPFHVDQLLERLQELQEELSQNANPPIPPEWIKALITLAHPDKHHGSPLAHETTVWLLDLREQERRAA